MSETKTRRKTAAAPEAEEVKGAQAAPDPPQAEAPAAQAEEPEPKAPEEEPAQALVPAGEPRERTCSECGAVVREPNDCPQCGLLSHLVWA